MKNFIKFIIAIVIVFFLGCSNKSSKLLTISTNTWIGYVPLFYLDATNKLNSIGFDLIINVSLNEAMDVYMVKKADLVTTTQHEYYKLKKNYLDIVPVILLDRSMGGDMIMSNKSLNQILSSRKIDVYLEIDSINLELLKLFMKKYHINEDKLIIHNLDQKNIVTTLTKHNNQAILVVTYTPYDKDLSKIGFKIIASTKNLETLIVLDSICTSKKIRNRYYNKLVILKKNIDYVINLIKSNPKKVYIKVKPYLNNISYKEFLESLKQIEWINRPSKDFLEKIEKLGYKKEFLIL